MRNICFSEDDYGSVAKYAGKMQGALGKKVSLGTAAGSACRFVLSETSRVEAAARQKQETKQ